MEYRVKVQIVEPQIGFCTNPDGARIAYGTLGQGSPIVMPPAYLASISPIEIFPQYRYLVDSFARYHSVVWYDQVGAGLSDRNRTVFTLESELRDLETVVDYLNIDRIIIWATSLSSPVAVAYAVKYPERVTHLILYGAYAYYGKYVHDEVKTALVSLLRHPDNWVGRRALASLCASQTQIDTLEMLVAAVKEVAAPEVAANVIDMLYRLDVTDLCPSVKTPTLVMHRKGDPLIDFKAGLELASLIPNARFVPLEGNDHFAPLGDTDSVLRNIFEFLGDPITDDKATKAVQPVEKQSCHDVFISFAFPDKESAAKIYTHLKRNGINPFWCEDLTAGQDYPQLLGEAIRNSESFLLVVSDSSDNSDTVRKETTVAHNSKKPIIPVRIKSVLPKNLEHLTANSLFFDAFPLPLEQYLPKLTSDIMKIIGSKVDKRENTIPEFQGDPIPKDFVDTGKAASSSLVAEPKTELKKKEWLRVDNPLVFILATLIASVLAGIILMMIKC